MLKNIIDLVRVHLFRSTFRKSVLILAGGTALAQLVQLLAYPILMRLYSPSEFGVFSAYGAIASMLAVIASARYEAAIMLPRSERRAAGLLKLSMLIALFWVAAIFVAIVLIELLTSGYLSSLPVANWVYWIPISVVLMAILQVLTAWINRRGHYQIMSRNRVVQTIATVGASGASSEITGGLILGQLTGLLVSAGTLIVRLRREDVWRATESQSSLRLKRLARIYRYFPMYSAPGALIGVAASQVPYLLMAYMFSSSALGHFSFAISIVQAPLALISRSVGSVYFQHASEARSRLELARLTFSTQKRMAALVLPLSFMVIFFGESIFGFFFGQQWEISGRYAAILMPYLALYAIFGATRDYISIVRVRGFELYFNAAIFSALTSAVLLGALMESFEVAVWAYSVTGTIAFLFLGVWMYLTSEGSIQQKH